LLLKLAHKATKDKKYTKINVAVPSFRMGGNKKNKMGFSPEQKQIVWAKALNSRGIVPRHK
jgi:hypothetical protein